jgi:hypothetical protein
VLHPMMLSLHCLKIQVKENSARNNTKGIGPSVRASGLACVDWLCLPFHSWRGLLRTLFPEQSPSN